MLCSKELCQCTCKLSTLFWTNFVTSPMTLWQLIRELIRKCNSPHQDKGANSPIASTGNCLTMHCRAGGVCLGSRVQWELLVRFKRLTHLYSLYETVVDIWRCCLLNSIKFYSLTGAIQYLSNESMKLQTKWKSCLIAEWCVHPRANHQQLNRRSWFYSIKPCSSKRGLTFTW
jgi:hypothetical protein